MKKATCIFLALILCAGFLLGCTPPPVVEGGPLVKEDFMFYKDGKVSQNPDNEEDGCVVLRKSEGEVTARSIKVGDSLEHAQKAYGVLSPDKYGNVELDDCGYVLSFSFDDHEKITSIHSYNAEGMYQRDLGLVQDLMEEPMEGNDLWTQLIADEMSKAQRNYARRVALREKNR